MGFPSTVANKALLACNRHCCICHKFCGPKIELHHIRQKAKGGKDSFDNCIPLCFDCRADMGKVDPMLPKGKTIRRKSYANTEINGMHGLQIQILEREKKFIIIIVSN